MDFSNASLSNPTTCINNADPPKCKTVNSGNYSVLQLFVESPWEKNEIKNLGEWLSSLDIDVSNEFWYLTFRWTYNNENATNEEAFKARITTELKNVLPLLLHCNDDVNYTNDDGQTILHAYLANEKSDYRVTYPSDHTTQETVNSDNTSTKIAGIVKALIHKGASVNTVDNRGKTPLHIAAQSKDKLEVIRLMLDFFTNVNACDLYGNTVLHSVLDNNSGEDNLCLNIVEILLSKGADLNIQNKAGTTPVQLAIGRCNNDFLQILEKYGADFSVITSNNESLLHMAYYKYYPNFDETELAKMTDFLVKQGCDVNAKDIHGFTPLHYAVVHGRSVDKLIEVGADVNCQTTIERKTPLHLALADRRIWSAEIITSLWRAGAYCDAEDSEGRTPVDVTIANDNSDTFEIIAEFRGNINNPNTVKLWSQTKIQHVVIVHAVKLKAIGFPIDEAYDHYISEEEWTYCNYQKRYLDEVNKLKTCLISDGVSIYEFLHMNGSEQLAYVDLLPEGLESKFPKYAKLILAICKDVIRRNEMLEPAKKVWKRITKINLPNICVDRILEFLNNWHLKVLIDAGEARAFL